MPFNSRARPLRTSSATGAGVAAYVERGVKVVGGCCGSTPEHIAAVAQAVRT
jgi:methionine synthase I (cobalamin-dependent)